MDAASVELRELRIRPTTETREPSIPASRRTMQYIRLQFGDEKRSLVHADIIKKLQTTSIGEFHPETNEYKLAWITMDREFGVSMFEGPHPDDYQALYCKRNTPFNRDPTIYLRFTYGNKPMDLDLIHLFARRLLETIRTIRPDVNMHAWLEYSLEYLQ